MSKNRNRAKFNNAQTSREYHIMIQDEKYPPYWDDGVIFYPRYRRGNVNPHRYLTRYQMREYRSWKHNRKTQYKT